ncbi:MAG: hypothetical protein NZ108_03820, partial [Bacteroidia bacterium]|nr:hypothetical protein [Bacteroidia bacterium]
MMKRIKLLAISALLSSTLFAQSQRTVLMEGFTNASCPPCAAIDPYWTNLITSAGNKLVVVKYHTDWPGTDPMNAANPTEVDARVSFYSVTGVPNAVLDGNVEQGSPGSLTASDINNRYAVPSPYTLTVTNTLGSDDTLRVTVTVTKTGNISTTDNLYVNAIEKEVHYPTPPGSNGLKDFHYVMRKMI